ncbi:cardiolipin synthase [Chitinasiproducens palmae]|uniref:Cardiolipin synthase A n=1 Tax=Chitinasiproducens palmae TaxID=1770053 RepID=A0A1H2PM40_9BURK|nr:cardiolipin synthase [Chitinasiproducens palmae]SDV47495.1 cardiolipin synthetase 2 [Chitinasiproducens palmae]
MHLSLLDVGSLLLFIHWLGLAAACHAVLRARTSQGAIAWAVALGTMPYLTLVPYLFLGSSRFAGYIDARRSGNRQVRARALGSDWQRFRDDALRPAQRSGELLGHHASVTLERLTGMPLVGGNQVRTLINGAATFDAIFAAIAAARSYVIVQFFIVRDDALGARLATALAERAAAGVKVHLLYDGIGSHDLSRRYVRELRAAGVEVHKFATGHFINRFQLNFRNHRKIVVVDGECAFVGGHNVGVEYLGDKPPLSPWRDTHIEIRGPAVGCIQFAFLEDWYWATQRVAELAHATPVAGDMRCQVVATGPADAQETCSLFFVEAINAAKTRLWITTPYFVPDEAVFAALRLAALRGVDVRVLMPARRDHLVVFSASTLYAHDAVRAGVRVFRYQPGFLHQKVILIDDVAAAVGSPNLDNRSFRLNFELTVLTIDRDFATEVRTMLEADFAQSSEIAAAEFTGKPGWQRAAMHIARLFAPIL